MELAFGLIGTLTGLLGIVISILSYNHNRIEAIKTYYENIRQEAFVQARRTLRNLPDDYDPKNLSAEARDKLAYLIIAYHQAGVLLRKRQLPMWAFNGSIGYNAISAYNKLEPYIALRREKEPFYADNFEFIYKRILKKHPNWKELAKEA